jgi:glycosyltransferase involved in cell wall biosynthesis
LVEQTIEYLVYAHFISSLPFYLLFLKPFLYLDVGKLKWWEKYYWKQASLVVAVSEADKKKMVNLVPDLKVGVVPNGAGEDLMKVWGSRKPAKKPAIFFQANFSWLQNIEAARSLVKDVFPLIKRKVPDSQCWIVGQGAQEKIGQLASGSVKVVDLKTADIQGVIDAYEKATVFVAPLEGPGGTRLKILAAMAAGVPVVATTVGIQGIKARNNKEALIARNWKEMAEATVKLLEDKKKYQSIARSARKLVEDHYSYQSISHLLDKVYQKVAYGKI